MGRHREFDTESALEAALSVFWKKGYKGASFGDLSEAMKVARPGIYAAFGNKEALFLRALNLYITKYMGFMTEALEEPTSFQVVERILCGSADIQTMISSTQGCMGTNDVLAGSEDDPIKRALLRWRAEMETALHKRLELAKDQGDLPASANAGGLARFVMTLTQGMAVDAKAGATRDALYEVVDHALATWPGRRVDRSLVSDNVA